MRRTLASMLAAAAAALPFTAGAQLVSYIDSSTPDQLKGKVDMVLGGPRAGLLADMTLSEQEGITKVSPRITSSWAPLDALGVKTVLQYADLNAATPNPTMSTSIVLRSQARFVERVEATLHGANSTARDSLQMQFRKLDTGLGLLGGETLGFRTDMKVESSGGQPAASSTVSSSWGVGRALKMQSVLRFSGAPDVPMQRSALDTKLVYRTSLSFIDRLEGEIHRGLDGDRHSLAMLLRELSSSVEHGASFKLTGKALLREIERADGTESRRVGLETKFVGVLPPLLGGRNALSFKVERGLGEELRSSSLDYDHAWSPAPETSIGLRVKMLQQADDLEPSWDLRWSARF